MVVPQQGRLKTWRNLEAFESARLRAVGDLPPAAQQGMFSINPSQFFTFARSLCPTSLNPEIYSPM